MGFDVGRVVKGISSGGLSELPGLFNSGQTTQNQVPLETPEQAAARKKLLDFANTGTFGAYTAGADIGIKPGDYGMTGLETQGQTALQQLLNGGIPSQFKLGDNALADLLNPNIQAQFQPFVDQTNRQTRTDVNAARANAGYTGSLYGTSAIKTLGDVQSRANETLTSKLASLTNDALNRRLQAIPLAYQSGQAQQNILNNNISSAYQYGALPRTLNNASIDSSNAELLRRRNELLQPINAAGTVAGQNSNFGVPQVTTQNPNPMLDLLTAIIGGGSKILAAKAA